MKLAIRRLKPEDIGPLMMMVRDLYEMHSDYPKIDDEEMDKLAFGVLSSLKDPRMLYLMAFDGKQPVGFLMAHISYRVFGKPKVLAEADELYVVPEKRGQIVGLRLIEEGVKLAIAAGAEGIEAHGGYGTTDKKWIGVGFKPYRTHLWISMEDATRTLMRGGRKAQAA